MNNMNAAAKMRLADQQIKRQRGKSLKSLLYTLLLLCSLGLLVVSAVMQIKSYGSYDNNALKLLKTFFYVGLGAFAVGFVVFGFASVQTEMKGLVAVAMGLNVLAAAVLLVVTVITLGKGVLPYDRYVVMNDDGVVYAQVNDKVEIVELLEDKADIVIRGEIEGLILKKIPNSGFKGTNSIKTLTFTDGNIAMGKRTFKGCQNLEKVTFGPYTYVLKDYVFSECPKLKIVDFGAAVIETDSGGVGQFYFGTDGLNGSTQPTCIVSGGTLQGNLESLKTVKLGPNSRFYPGDTTGTLVLEDGFDFNQKTEVYYNKGVFATKYAPAAYDIYIPSSVTNIPENFFGDHVESGHKYRVYYQGSQEEWQIIAIKSEGNSNLTNGNIEVIFDTFYED